MIHHKIRISLKQYLKMVTEFGFEHAHGLIRLKFKLYCTLHVLKPITYVEEK